MNLLSEVKSRCSVRPFLWLLSSPLKTRSPTALRGYDVGLLFLETVAFLKGACTSECACSSWDVGTAMGGF